MKALISLWWLMIFIQNGNAQHFTYPNFDYNNPNMVKIEKLLDQYFNNPEHSDSLWSSADKAKYKDIDVIKNSVGLGAPLYKLGFTANVLGIYPVGEDYIAKVMIYWNNDDSVTKQKKVTVMGIADYLIVKEAGTYKLSNYINYASRDWYKQSYGKIKYIYHPAHPFDRFKAEAASRFLDKIQDWFDLPAIDTITYFIAPDCEGIYKLSGFEYFEGQGGDGNDLCGYIDDRNHIIYSNTVMGEDYKHELVHVINAFYPDGNSLLLSGLSVYINNAGSVNNPLSFHVARYMNYVKENHIDLQDYQKLWYYDQITNPRFVFGGLICNAILRKGGLPLLKKALKSTKTDEELDAFLKKELHVKDYNEFFTNEAEIFLKQPKVLLTTD